VDDEFDIRDAIQEYLSFNGFDVTAAESAAAARRVLAGRKPVDLVITDVRMPGEDGISLARSLREKGGIGIMMLTASGEVVDRIIGYEVGADDYMVKPFDLRELLARVKSLLRRVGSATVPAQTANAKRLRFGRVLNRDQLLELAHNGGQSDPFDRSIDIRVTRLRRKIEAEPSKPQFIKTARGAGYVFSPDGT
jgi:two-component system phosphate regulon response regulator OmpR